MTRSDSAQPADHPHGRQVVAVARNTHPSFAPRRRGGGGSARTASEIGVRRNEHQGGGAGGKVALAVPDV